MTYELFKGYHYYFTIGFGAKMKCKTLCNAEYFYEWDLAPSKQLCPKCQEAFLRLHHVR